MIRRAFLILLLAATAWAQPWQDAGPGLAALKARFNQESAAPRVLLLVSPT